MTRPLSSNLGSTVEVIEVGGIDVEIPDGEPKREPRQRRRYTPEECIQLARVWERETGAAPTKNDWSPAVRRYKMRGMLDRLRQHRATIQRFEEGGYPSDITVRKLFGSWNAFIHASGWEPREGGRPRIHTAERPKTPNIEQVRRRVGQQADRTVWGRDALAGVVRNVLAAEKAGDKLALKGVLLDGAAQLLAWADALDRGEGR